MATSECVRANAGSENVGLAFGIVTAAGLSTTLGAALAFVMPYSRSSKNLFLAACLALAAGVMLYVSFVEIFVTKALDEFEKCFTNKEDPDDTSKAYLYATLCFFGGIVITWIFDQLLHVYERCIAKRSRKKNPKYEDSPIEDSTDTPPIVENPTNPSDVEGQAEPQATPETPRDERMVIDHNIGHDGEMIAAMYENEDQDSKALARMGIFAGIALAFHNFPEGLATFIAVLEDPSVGASIAIAIGIHNIPEGVCVAMPIYYATGSRFKAFFWATLSGLTELIGAFLGWIILRKVITPIIYGVLFGIVAGMMVYISLKELLPTAHRYDPEDKVTSLCLLLGMVVMALSLVLFQF